MSRRSDLASAIKYRKDMPVSAKYEYIYGASQTGRFLREFLYDGFNADEQGRKTFALYLNEIDERLAGRQWLLDDYSVLDPYAFVFYSWGVRRELAMAELEHYGAFKERMLARPAVRRIIAEENIRL